MVGCVEACAVDNGSSAYNCGIHDCGPCDGAEHLLRSDYLGERSVSRSVLFAGRRHRQVDNRQADGLRQHKERRYALRRGQISLALAITEQRCLSHTLSHQFDGTGANQPDDTDGSR